MKEIGLRFIVKLFMLAMAGLVLASLFQGRVWAHGQLHARACAGETPSSNCQNGFKNHTGCNQWVERQIGYVTQWEGDAFAFAHASVHPNCGWHFHIQLSASSGPFGGSGASGHANHAVHFASLAAAAGLPGQTGEPDEEPPRPELPPGSDTMGGLVILEMEAMQKEGMMMFNFGLDPEARLQVDGKNLKPGDESTATLDLTIGSATGRLRLSLVNGRVAFLQEGVFERVPLRVESPAGAPDIFLVRLGSALNFELPGLVEEADVELNGETVQKVVSSPCAPDRLPPELFCPELIVEPCQSAAGAPVLFNVVATDNCDSNVTVTCTPPAGSWFPKGTNQVVCVAVDASGLEAQCRFPVIVYGACREDDCILLECPKDIVRPCEGEGGAKVAFEVTADNRCGRAATIECEPPSGSIFPVGLTTVVCTAGDDAGHQSRCSFTVEVEDTKPPTLDGLADIVVDAQGPDGALVQWQVSATDNCSGAAVVLCEPPSGSLFPPGSTPVSCLAKDASGNVGLGGFMVTVRPPRPLEILPGSDAGVLLRWFGTGTPEETDAIDPKSEWRPVRLPIEHNGQEKTMAYPGITGNKYFRLAASPLAPPPDADRDGVADSVDRCPRTPAGLAVDRCGCAAVEIGVRPEVILQPIQESLQRAAEEIGQAIGFEEVAAHLQEVQGLLTEAEEFLLRTELHEGLALYQDAVGHMEEAQSLFARLEAEMNLLPAGEIVPGTHGYGDVTDGDVRRAGYGILAGLLADALGRSREAGQSLARLTSADVQERLVEGTIVALNDAEHSMKLDNGMLIGLGSRVYGPDLFEGNRVSVQVMDLGGSSGLAKDVIAASSDFPLPTDLAPAPCLRLRIAPVQRMEPYYPPPYVLHNPQAYTHNEVLYLEQGMRLGVVGSCNSGGLFSFNRYSMQLALSYKSKNNLNKNVILAHDLRSIDAPVEFPSDMSEVPAVLTASLRRRQCTIIGLNMSCSTPVRVSVQTYNVIMKKRFSYALALYDQTVVDLKDAPVDTGFRPLQVTGLFKMSVLSGKPGVNFQAEGYQVQNNQSTRPNVMPIYTGTPFALHNSDFYSEDYLFDPIYFTGVTNAAGLKWPQATGQHNGYSFAYACGLPWVVRDLLNECGTSFEGYSGLASYYRLPFRYGWPFWIMGQGNFGSFTHNGAAAFAYDFLANAGTQILAARGGKVVGVLESRSANCYVAVAQQCVNCVPNAANYVVIRHQDGTYGWYFHMPLNGVSVSMNQKVYRGDPIGVVGNTGCSSDPHVHFEARQTVNGASIAVNFEPCFSPGPGDFLFSNNKPWWE